MNSEYKLTDTNMADNYLKSFAELIGCPVMAVSADCTVVKNYKSCGLVCPLSGGDNCINTHRHAAFQSERFEGKYIYLCPAQKLFCVARIAEDSALSYLAGPMTLAKGIESCDENVSKSFFDGDSTSDALCCRVFTPEQVNYVSDMLLAVAGAISGYEYKKLVSMRAGAENQRKLSDYIQSIKARLMLGVNGYTPYPYDKEKKLTYAIITGNSDDARRYLNEILGHIFFASANNLDSIKIRAMELTVLISRAAIDGGADECSIYEMSPEFISDFFSLTTIEDVCVSLTDILNHFTEATFKTAPVKHVELISKAVSYINANYMHKISLDDTAEHIYLSPSYLSKIFAEEMKMPFSTYLNSVRIDKSKILLRSEALSVSEVAELVGYYDQSYFNKVFKKIVGVTPKKYREEYGSDGVF